MGNLLYTNFNEEMDRFEHDLKQFVIDYPDKIHLLEAIRAKEKDPYVERLFSGVAFLVSKLREELDTNVEYISESVLEQHWPLIFQKYPSMMIVEASFASNPSWVKFSKGMPIIKTAQLGPEKVECIFSTISEENIIPFKLGRTAYEGYCNDCLSVLSIDFVSEISDEEKKQSSLKKVKLYLNFDKYDALELYGALTKDVQKIELCTLGGVLCIGDQSLISGCDEDKNILDMIANVNSFSEPGVIMDFFSFVEKFLFVELKGIPFVEEKYFSIKIYFNKKVFKLKGNFIDLSGKIKINCMMTINCYRKFGEPFEVLKSEVNYPVVVDMLRKESILPISVIEVNKFFDKKIVPCQRINGANFPAGDMRNFYSVSKVPVKGSLDKMYFQFHFLDEESAQIISYDAFVCNGNIPAEFINSREKFLLKEKGCSVSISILGSPTKIRDLFKFKRNSLSLMAHLAINFSSLVDIKKLKEVLSWYVPDDNNKINHQRYIYSLKKTKLINRDFLERGVMKNQWDLYFLVDLTDFVNVGEAILWFEVLSKFIVNYAPINKKFKAIFESLSAEESWTFCYEHGLKSLL